MAPWLNRATLPGNSQVTSWKGHATIEIVIDDLEGPEIAEFLAEHLADMKSVSPPESKHALDLDGLRTADVTFWTVLDGSSISACGALKAIDGTHAELKSMRTSPRYRGRGVASMLLEHIILEARRMGYTRLSLETGSFDFFEPARRLYLKHDFELCPPIPGYKEDPNSVFMTRAL